MTNQEAIDALQDMIDCVSSVCVEQEWIDAIPLAIAALEKQENDSWILADDIPPKFPCLTVDGMGNYPKAWHSIVTITDEHGKKLYFTDDIFHFGMVDKAYKPIICEQNAIKWWKPLDRPE